MDRAVAVVPDVDDDAGHLIATGFLWAEQRLKVVKSSECPLPGVTKMAEVLIGADARGV